MKLFLFLSLFLTGAVRAEERPEVRGVFLSNAAERFSFHQPTYFIGGKDDLKLQFSFKYRVARKIPLYFAYSQLMFWDFFDDSSPFRDTNYRPELFYRFLERDTSFISSLDAGYMHFSNGRDEDDSRSLERIFLRSNMLFKFAHRQLGVIFTGQYLFDEDSTNRDIVQYIGNWEAILYLSKLASFEGSYTDLEVRTYAGSSVYNFDQGAVQVGLIHRFVTADFNPSIYFQYFEGYAEDLLSYDRKRSRMRLGLMLSF